jgi:hypothetical protein
MNDAGCGNDLVGGVASNIETTALATNLQGQRPGMNLVQSSSYICVLYIDLDAT